MIILLIWMCKVSYKFNGWLGSVREYRDKGIVIDLVIKFLWCGF